MRPLLGTFVEIRARRAAALTDAALEALLAAAFAAIERVDRLMSFHRADSDVARINAAGPGESVRVDAETWTVLAAARRFSELSGGAFDITTAARLVESGFLPRPQGRAPFPDVSFIDLELLAPGIVSWRRPGWIDLGGIAKGYAVDRALTVLRAHGAADGVVNAGGDLRCFGRPCPIHVRVPQRPAALLAVGRLIDGAIATSAGYFRGGDTGGARLEPLVDPIRGRCRTWEGSVSAIAADCMTADALTKVVRLLPERSPALLEQLGAQAVLLERRGLRVCGRRWL
jgi:thiamine biosynthesis lipoprotein